MVFMWYSSLLSETNSIFQYSDNVANTLLLSLPTADPDVYIKKLKWNWAKGPHLELLNSHINDYCAALIKGYSCLQEYVDLVVKEYFNKFPWQLKVSEDPVSMVSDAPSTEKLSTTEMEQKWRKVAAMRKVSVGTY